MANPIREIKGEDWVNIFTAVSGGVIIGSAVITGLFLATLSATPMGSHISAKVICLVPAGILVGGFALVGGINLIMRKEEEEKELKIQ